MTHYAVYENLAVMHLFIIWTQRQFLDSFAISRNSYWYSASISPLILAERKTITVAWNNNRRPNTKIHDSMHAQTMWMLREGTIRVDMNCDATCKQPNGTGLNLERNYTSLDPWYLLNDQSFNVVIGGWYSAPAMCVTSSLNMQFWRPNNHSTAHISK